MRRLAVAAWAALALVACARQETCLAGSPCGGACVQLATDNAHCGACGNACGAGLVCSAGQCQPSCAAPLATCDLGGRAGCADLRTDPAHCGACGSACPGGQVCTGAACRPACAAPLAICGQGAEARCADLRTDPTHCGACGSACPGGQVCTGAACRPACAAPLAICGQGAEARCADLRTDPAHCGACGSACPGGQVCTDGACRPACGAPLAVCGEGELAACADLRSDPAHCGACGSACPGGQVCAAGACAPACAAPLTACGTGTEARCLDLRSDPASCGACGSACARGEACLEGTCTATCAGSGGTLCGEACVQLDSDDAHCGACGRACAPGHACGGGSCTLSCPTPQIACAGACLDPRADPAHCGVCGNACATGICREGTCAAPACQGTLALPGRPLPAHGSSSGQAWDHALADLDGDGRLDLAVARSDRDLVEVRYLIAPGTFAPPLELPVGAQPGGVAAGDLDGDGRIDLVACGAGGGGTLTVLRNRGGGSFERSDLPAGGPASRCTLGDLDGDGRPDLAVSYPSIDRIGVASNVGGALAPPVLMPSAKPSPANLAIVDLDGDGVAELVVLNTPWNIDLSWADVDLGSVAVYPGMGGGLLGAPSVYAAGAFPMDMVVADLDGDGRPDVATAVFDEDAVALLLNDGHGGLLPRASVAVGTRPVSIAAGDLEGNGTLDLAVNRYYDDVVLLRNLGGAVFAAPEAYPIAFMTELALADADDDGRLDLLLTDAPPRVILQEDGRLLTADAFPVGGRSEQLVSADLDGDGHRDLVVGLLDRAEVAILRGTGTGAFQAATFLAAPGGAQALVAGDLDGDGKVDLLYAWGGSVTLRRNLGAGAFGPEEPIYLGMLLGPLLTLADLDGDGHLDLVAVERLSSPSLVQVLWNDGRGQLTPGPSLRAGWAADSPAAVGDVTGDGRADVVVANWMDGTLSIFAGSGQRRLEPWATLPVGPHPRSPVVADLTQDGRPDLAFVTQGDLYWGTGIGARILPGTGAGLGAPIALPVEGFPMHIRAGDLDSDGRPDALVVCSGALVLHRGLAGGGFAAPLRFEARVPDDLVLVDVDGDFRLDAVELGSHPGSVTVHRSRCLAR